MTDPRLYLRVAIATPLRRLFTYLPPVGIDPAILQPGQRLRVPFGRRQAIGILLETSQQCDIEIARLKRAQALLDEAPLLSATTLALLQRASDYYQHPPGEVIFGCLPTALRQGQPATPAMVTCWQITATCPDNAIEQLNRAPRQQAVLELLLHNVTHNLDSEAFVAAGLQNWQPALRQLEHRGWIQRRQLARKQPEATTVATQPAFSLNAEQQLAVAAIVTTLGSFQVHLLDGITGSGKTEVYLQTVAEVLQRGEQVLVLLPEIALTPQLIARFRERFNSYVAVLHSGLNDSERLQAWLQARAGSAQLILGTRSAVWTPLARPGLIVVDEEHDLSFKQQDGFRYHARDVAIMRAQREQIPIILGSATPSLESLHNANLGRYSHLHLRQRAGNAQSPVMQLLDIRQAKLHSGLSDRFIEAISARLDANQQILLFINRRGYAPVLLCHDCGWQAVCQRCETAMTLHKAAQRLRCHHCGHEQPLTRNCGGCQSENLLEVGQGTERIVEALAEIFPAAHVVRIDRDSTRRRGSLQNLLDSIHSGAADILVGTQMLAKGHHFPNVALVGIVDADGGLYSSDFRAPERLAQLILQVSGRAGRAEQPGTVIIQTHQPQHPLLVQLISAGYDAFAATALAEREQAGLPPFSHLALLRAEAPTENTVATFLQEARALMQHQNGELQLLGPVAAPRPKRAGHRRMQLLLQAQERQTLRNALPAWLLALENLPGSRKVRWSLDVDPQELA